MDRVLTHQLRLTAVTFAAGLGLLLAGCGSSAHHQARARQTGSVLATPTAAADGLDRFSAPGMALHFLYPTIFRPELPARPTQSEGQASASSNVYAEVGLSARDVLFVVEIRDPRQRVTRANATRVQGGLDAEIDSLTESETASEIHYGHGDVVFEWPAVIQPNLPDDSTDQYSEVFTPTQEYELECIADPADRARVDTACSEALASLSISGR